MPAQRRKPRHSKAYKSWATKCSFFALIFGAVPDRQLPMTDEYGPGSHATLYRLHSTFDTPSLLSDRTSFSPTAWHYRRWNNFGLWAKLPQDNGVKGRLSIRVKQHRLVFCRACCFSCLLDPVSDRCVSCGLNTSYMPRFSLHQHCHIF